MKKLPYFPFYPGEWLRSPTVLGMTLEEQGAYLRLLCWQWEDGHIDPEDISLFLGMEQEAVDQWFSKRHWKRAFVKCEDGMLRNERMRLEREQAMMKCESAAAAAHARWAKHKADGKPKVTRRNASAELQAALQKLADDGVAVPSGLAAAMDSYREARRESRKPVWSKEQWLKNLGGEYSFEEWQEAYEVAARAGWASVHPKKKNEPQRKQGKALKSLQEWVEHDDLPY
ncbi:MAG: hypothetical protein ACO3O3_08605 [Ilumatobacteraceae bacterium]